MWTIVEILCPWLAKNLDRIEHVGTGATTRAARRAQRRARRSAFYAAEDARHEHGRYQEADHSGDGARFWAYNDG